MYRRFKTVNNKRKILPVVLTMVWVSSLMLSIQGCTVKVLTFGQDNDSIEKEYGIVFKPNDANKN